MVRQAHHDMVASAPETQVTVKVQASNREKITWALVYIFGIAALAWFLHITLEREIEFWRLLAGLEFAGIAGQLITIFIVRPWLGFPPLYKTRGKFRF